MRVNEFFTITETCLYKAKPVAMEISLHISIYEWYNLIFNCI